MAASETRRSVTMSRSGPSTFVATNVRGGTMEIGGDEENFTPVELLLVAMGACSGIDVDILTSRRAEPTRFDVDVVGDKVRDENGNHLQDIVTTFTVTFPEGAEGDAARIVLPDAVKRSHERLCTVTRTVILPTSVSAVVAD
jgi:putative redox protein